MSDSPGKPPGGRRLLRYLRVTHIYLAMLGSLLMCFFALTGLILNHEETLLGEASRESQFQTPLTPELEEKLADSSSVEAYAREQGWVRGRVTASSADGSYIELTFERPAYRADVTVDREAGQIEVFTRNDGPVAALTQLHRGRHAPTGKWWPWVVDAAAVLLLIASLTGIGLLLSLKRHRKAGLAAAATGIALAAAAYLLLVL